MATGNYAAIVQAVTPAQKLPAHDILAFSEQVMYGEALMGQHQWPAARAFWQQLLKISQDPEQQQYVQAKLAATLVYSGDIASIFVPDSAVTNLRFRSQVLKAQQHQSRCASRPLAAPTTKNAPSPCIHCWYAISPRIVLATG